MSSKRYQRNCLYKTLVLVLAIVGCAQVRAATYGVDDVPNVHLADRTRFVSNPDGILSDAAVQRADSLLSHIRQTSTAEAVAVVVDDIEGGDIDTFATELFTNWELGKSDLDNGVLILVAKDLRRAVIRTGYGVEGVLPDIVAGRLLREVMFPAFKEGDYDAGVVGVIEKIDLLFTDPDAAAELRSSMADADNGDAGRMSPFEAYVCFAALLAVVMIVVLTVRLVSLQGKDGYQKYQALESWRAPGLALSFLGLGLPLVAVLPLVIMLQRWRNKTRYCPNCKARMRKIDEVHDNAYLTPSQDLEERLGSVDYDVWFCPECGERDIYPFFNKHSALIECEACHARAAQLKVNRVLSEPTTTREGKGERQYHCHNCGHITRKYYQIAKAAPVVVLPVGGGGGNSGGFGGGGSFGGGFGGGMTGGGGASGGW